MVIKSSKRLIISNFLKYSLFLFIFWIIFLLFYSIYLGNEINELILISILLSFILFLIVSFFIYKKEESKEIEILEDGVKFKSGIVSLKEERINYRSIEMVVPYYTTFGFFDIYVNELT